MPHDQTVADRADRLAARYPASLREYGAIGRHILGMADMLSNSLIQRSPVPLQLSDASASARRSGVAIVGHRWTLKGHSAA